MRMAIRIQKPFTPQMLAENSAGTEPLRSVSLLDSFILGNVI
jgi:hypothetical protein